MVTYNPVPQAVLLVYIFARGRQNNGTGCGVWLTLRAAGEIPLL